MDQLLNDKYLRINVPDFLIQLKTDNINRKNFIFLKNLKYIDIKNINNINNHFVIYIFEPLTDTHFRKKFIQYKNKIKDLDKIYFLTYCKFNYNFLIGLKLKCFFYSINYYNFNDLIFSQKNKNVINYRSFDNSYFNHKYNSTIINIKEIQKKNLIILNHFGTNLKNIYKETKIFINLHKKEDSKCLETFRI